MPLRLWILEGEADNCDSPQKEDNTTAFLSALTEDERYIFEERAGIMEFDGGLIREDAERQARQAFQRRP